MLTLYYHPLASYCWKVLIALYENATPFHAHFVDLGNEAARAALKRLTPFCKFPVLHDAQRDRTITESTSIIEYLVRYYPGASPLIPSDLEAAFDVRAQDRFFDLHVHDHMQKIVDDLLRPADAKDPLGVTRARANLKLAYQVIEGWADRRSWATGEAFTLADCAAAPALYYAARVEPLGNAHPCTARYLQRLVQRPTVARVLAEAQPYAHLFPG